MKNDLTWQDLAVSGRSVCDFTPPLQTRSSPDFLFPTHRTPSYVESVNVGSFLLNLLLPAYIKLHVARY